jgi:hypothetical protein
LLPFYVLARFKSNNQLEIAKEMEFIDIEELRLEIMFEFEATEFKEIIEETLEGYKLIYCI